MKFKPGEKTTTNVIQEEKDTPMQINEHLKASPFEHWVLEHTELMFLLSLKA